MTAEVMMAKYTRVFCGLRCNKSMEISTDLAHLIIIVIKSSADNFLVLARRHGKLSFPPFLCKRVQGRRWLSTAPRNSSVASAVRPWNTASLLSQDERTWLSQAKPPPVTLLIPYLLATGFRYELHPFGSDGVPFERSS
jgi:hypothetical protein